MNPTKEKLIKEAIRLFSVHGFAETSFQAIADRAKLSQSAVLYHFRSRDGLIEEVIHFITKHNHEIVSGLMSIEDDARERLRKHFEGNLEWGVKFRDEAQILILLYYMGTFHKKFSKLYEERQAEARERIEACLHAGRREKVMRFKTAPARLSQLLHDALLGGFINALSVPDPKSQVDGLKKNWVTLFDSLLGPSE